jgi:hypothetical protein
LHIGSYLNKPKNTNNLFYRMVIDIRIFLIYALQQFLSRANEHG